MASQWHSLISQKIFLAKTLLEQRDNAESTPVSEALWQGSVELALRSRQLLMVMIARFYQNKQGQPKELSDLRALLGNRIPEIAELERLAREPSNWWGYLDQLEVHQIQPSATKKTVSDENIIAVSVDRGPDRSSGMLRDALTELKYFTDVLEERHSEW